MLCISKKEETRFNKPEEDKSYPENIERVRKMGKKGNV